MLFCCATYLHQLDQDMASSHPSGCQGPSTSQGPTFQQQAQVQLSQEMLTLHLHKAEVSEQKVETFCFYCQNLLLLMSKPFALEVLLGRNTKSPNCLELAQATRRQLTFFFLFKIFYLIFRWNSSGMFLEVWGNGSFWGCINMPIITVCCGAVSYGSYPLWPEIVEMVSNEEWEGIWQGVRSPYANSKCTLHLACLALPSPKRQPLVLFKLAVL